LKSTLVIGGWLGRSLDLVARLCENRPALAGLNIIYSPPVLHRLIVAECNLIPSNKYFLNLRESLVQDITATTRLAGGQKESNGRLASAATLRHPMPHASRMEALDRAAGPTGPNLTQDQRRREWLGRGQRTGRRRRARSPNSRTEALDEEAGQGWAGGRAVGAAPTHL
jgi:hypothetical protein